jgi:hypothetical protein
MMLLRVLALLWRALLGAGGNLRGDDERLGDEAVFSEEGSSEKKPEPEARVAEEGRCYYCSRCAAAYIDREGGCEYCPGQELSLTPPAVESLGEMTLLVTLPDWLEAQRLRLELEAARVPARVETRDILGLFSPPTLSAHRVLAPAHCLSRAREILRDFYNAENPSPEAAANGEP